MRADQICHEVTDVSTYGDVFWLTWLTNQADIENSIYAFCASKNYVGDPRDLLHDVMIVARERWAEFTISRSRFKTWVLWIAKEHMSKVFRQRLPIPGVVTRPKDGVYAGTLPSALSLDGNVDGAPLIESLGTGAPPAEDAMIDDERAATLREYMRTAEGKKALVLRAMADLAETGMDLPSSRVIAELVPFSHTTVRKVLLEIKGDLERMGI